MKTSPKRRVLIIVQNLPVPFDRRVWQESRELARHGYTVSVICPKGRGCEASYEEIEGVHVHRHRPPMEARGWKAYALEYSWSLLCQMLLAWRIFFIRGFDVIQACNPPDNIFLIALPFKLLFGTRFIFDHHDLCPELYEAKFGRRGLGHRLLLLFERLTFLTADVSIATNGSYRQIAITRGGMPPERVFTVRSGPNLDRLRILPPAERLKQGRQFLIGYVGVMGRQEGLDLLLAAMRHIVYDLGREDIHCTLVGSGPELAALRQLAVDHRLADYVTFTGRVSDDELLAVLNTADVCVNPDTVNAMNDKSTMNKIMEYMALGKPIVQFELTEGRVSAGDASLYARANDPIDFAAKILELLADPERRAEMGRIGRARIENELAWHYGVPSLLAAYDCVFQQWAAVRRLSWITRPGGGALH
jgi:glycosyltransferase involved in cell wall biosynthesis